jgi:hypothetical protein
MERGKQAIRSYERKDCPSHPRIAEPFGIRDGTRPGHRAGDHVMKDDTFPPGCAIVTRVGWEHTQDGRQFTATLVFPNGAPSDLGYNTIWNKIPVRLVEENR